MDILTIIYVLATVSAVTSVSYFYIIPKIKKSIVFIMIKYMFRQLKTNFNKPLNVRINSNGKSILIKYSYRNHDYFIALPFNQKLIPRMNRQQIVLVDNNDNKFELITQPGIPLLVSPNDLGMKEIRIVEDDEIIEKYTGDEINKNLNY